jgi:hypothetical protein
MVIPVFCRRNSINALITIFGMLAQNVYLRQELAGAIWHGVTGDQFFVTNV